MTDDTTPTSLDGTRLSDRPVPPDTREPSHDAYPDAVDSSTDSSFLFPSRPRYAKWVMFAVLFFLAGVGTGAAASVLLFLPRATPPSSGEEIAERIRARLDRDYQLNPEEAATVRDAVDRHLSAIEEQRQRFNAEARKELAALRDQVETVLGEERAAEWDRDMTHHFGRHRAHPVDPGADAGGRHGGRGGHH